MATGGAMMTGTAGANGTAATSGAGAGTGAGAAATAAAGATGAARGGGVSGGDDVRARPGAVVDTGRNNEPSVVATITAAMSTGTSVSGSEMVRIGTNHASAATGDVGSSRLAAVGVCTMRASSVVAAALRGAATAVRAFAFALALAGGVDTTGTY